MLTFLALLAMALAGLWRFAVQFLA